MPRTIPDLGRKLDHLEGILGAELPSLVFQQHRQAQHLGVSASQLSRKRAGTQQVRDGELAKLIDLFRLGPSLDYRVFHLEFDAFDAALGEAGAGTHGAPTSSRHRRTLLDAADAGKPITIARIGRAGGPERAVGGIGGDLATRELPTLRPWDRIVVNVPLSPDGEDGHLLVLNDHPAGDQVACLMPSRFAPETSVRGRDLRLPLDGAETAFPVGRPGGFYRLFAVWTSQPLLELLDLPARAPDGVPELTPDAFGRLATFVGAALDRPSTTGVPRVAVADYQVVD